MKRLTRTNNHCTIHYKLTERLQMTLILLILGIASIFSAGVLANAYGASGSREAFYTSVIGFCFGTFALISMIGAIE